MFKELLDELYIAGAVVLRNAHTLPDATDNDIDLIARRKDLPAIEDVIREWGSRSGWRCIEKVQKSGYTGYWIYHSEFQRWMPIDVFTDLSWRGARFADIDSVITSAVKNESGVWTVSPGVEAAVTLCKELVQGSDLPERKWMRISRLIQGEWDDFSSVLGKYVGVELARELYDLVLDEKHLAATDMIQKLRAKLNSRLVHRGVGFCRFLSATLSNAVFGRLNFMVVVAGPDGSGKTSVVDFLEERFANAPFKKTRRCKLTYGILPELKTLLRRGGRLGGEQVKEPVGSESDSYLVGMVRPLPVWRALIYELYYGLDLFLGWARLLLWKGQWSFVLFDRYFTDYFYFKAHVRVPFWLKRCIYTFLAKPDLLIYLDCDPAGIFERKPELTEEEICRQQCAIRSNFSQYDYYASVNGDAGLDAVLVEVERVVQQKFFDKCKGF